MTGLAALNLPQPLVWILAFAIIFGLLAAFAHLLKRIAGGRGAELEGGRNRVPRLGLVDSFDLDRHRKLIIVRRDNVEHLLLVGPSDVVVESNIVRAAGVGPREERMIQAASLSVPPQPMPGPASSIPTAPTPAAAPIPPMPVTPQTAIEPAPAAEMTPVTPTAPVMPTAPFPVPPPVRPMPTGKGTMPPPPPFGAPKRPAQPQRVEPTLTTPTGLGPAVEAAKPIAPMPAPKVDAATQTKAIEDQAQPTKPVEGKSADPHPHPMPIAEPTVQAAPAQTQTMPLPPVPNPVPLPPEAASARGPTPALPPDLTSKLEDVLKVKITADDAIPQPNTRKVPLPAAESAKRAELPPLPPIPMVTAPEIAYAPEPAKPEPPATSSADAFEEELRRILGRAPQKG